MKTIHTDIETEPDGELGGLLAAVTNMAAEMRAALATRAMGGTVSVRAALATPLHSKRPMESEPDW